MPISAVVLGVVFIMFAIVYFTTNAFLGRQSMVLGTLSVPGNELSGVRTMVNRTGGASDGNYDSLDRPRGTTFSVSARTTLVITVLELPGVATTATAALTAGYGDDAVANSAAAPTNAVTLWSRSYSGQPQASSVAIEIPEGKVPWVRVQGTAGWSVSAAGVVR